MTEKLKETDFDKYLFVKESGIHGKGIFTAVKIPKDALITVISGEVISEKECIRREEEENNVYIFWNEHNYIDTANTTLIKYINHNCDPNCSVEEFDENSLSLIASRDIEAGEELTIDYGYDEIYDDCSCEQCVDEDDTNLPERKQD